MFAWFTESLVAISYPSGLKCFVIHGLVYWRDTHWFLYGAARGQLQHRRRWGPRMGNRTRGFVTGNRWAERGRLAAVAVETHKWVDLVLDLRKAKPPLNTKNGKNNSLIPTKKRITNWQQKFPLTFGLSCADWLLGDTCKWRSSHEASHGPAPSLPKLCPTVHCICSLHPQISYFIFILSLKSCFTFVVIEAFGIKLSFSFGVLLISRRIFSIFWKTRFLCVFLTAKSVFVWKTK